jgi:hypothetical protein
MVMSVQLLGVWRAALSGSGSDDESFYICGQQSTEVSLCVQLQTVTVFDSHDRYRSRVCVAENIGEKAKEQRGDGYGVMVYGPSLKACMNNCNACQQFSRPRIVLLFRLLYLGYLFVYLFIYLFIYLSSATSSGHYMIILGETCRSLMVAV